MAETMDDYKKELDLSLKKLEEYSEEMRDGVVKKAEDLEKLGPHEYIRQQEKNKP